MDQPLFTVICPVFNSANYIEETLRSIINQTYDNVEIIVIDGGSSDDTLEIIQRFSTQITHLISEPDNGMYDALAKGFELASGKYMGYINAGDFLNCYAIEAAISVFIQFDAKWITGCRSICNEKSIVTHVDLPFRYLRPLIEVGSYVYRLPFIQQETTFWERELLESVDLDSFRTLSVAGDCFLWWNFAKHTRLEVVSCPFGVFKKHHGQLSEDTSRYRNEVKQFAGRRNPLHFLLELIELSLWAFDPKIRSLFSNKVIRFDHRIQEWKRFSPWKDNRLYRRRHSAASS